MGQMLLLLFARVANGTGGVPPVSDGLPEAVVDEALQRQMTRVYHTLSEIRTPFSSNSYAFGEIKHACSEKEWKWWSVIKEI